MTIHTERQANSGVASAALRLRTNFGWAVTGNIAHAVGRWVMFMILAKAGGASMVGVFALAVAIVEPIVMFAELQLRTVLSTDAKGQGVFAEYLALRLILCGATILVAVGIVLINGYPAVTAYAIVGVAMWRAVDSTSDLFHGLFQRNERMDLVARSLIVKAVISVVLLGLAVHLSGDLHWAVAGLFVASLTVLLGHDVRNASANLGSLGTGTGPAETGGSVLFTSLICTVERRRLLELAGFAFPLGAAMLFVTLSQTIPRYVIEANFGGRELGIFAGMIYLVAVGNTIIAGLGRATSPRLAQFYQAGDYLAFKALLAKLIAITVVLGSAGVLIAVFAGKEVLTLLYRAEFAERAEVFGWIMLAGGIGYVASLLGHGITATRQFKRFVIPYLLIALLSALASLLLIPEYGVLGAAWALCLVNAAGCVAPAFILIRKRIP